MLEIDDALMLSYITMLKEFVTKISILSYTALAGPVVCRKDAILHINQAANEFLKIVNKEGNE